MFLETDDYFLVKTDFLPWNPNIKAAAVNVCSPLYTSRILVETTLIDWNLASRKARENRGKFKGLRIYEKGVYWNGQKVFFSCSKQVFGKTFSPRTLLYTKADMSVFPAEPLLMAIRLIFDHECFVAGAVPRPAVSAGEAYLKLFTPRMSRAEQLLVMREQVPMFMRNALREHCLFARKKRVLRLNGRKMVLHPVRSLKTIP